MNRIVRFLNPDLRIFAGWKGTFAILLLCTTVASPNAHPQPNANAKASVAATNTNPNGQSTFVQPKGPQEGKDPFFPRSHYPYTGPRPIVPPPTNAPPPVVVAVELKLKAISGLPEHRLALINNHTFEAGEEGEVITDKGRMRIRCLEIQQDSAVVQVGSERRELRLPNY